MKLPLPWVTVLSLSMLLTTLMQAQTAATETVTYSYNGQPLPIFADAADIVSIANIPVPRALRITTVSVRVQIEFSGVGDLNVFMFSPQATRTKLMERNCGATVNVDTTFDDTAVNRYSDFCPTEPGRGPFRPIEPLANYRDQSSLGLWSLAVENNGSNSKVGWLLGFSVTITGTRIVTPTIVSQGIVNAASYKTGPVAPGEMVSIFGIGIGPVAPVTAPAGNLPTTLGGTTVTFDGAAVPISYASLYRVDVQAPTGIAAGATTTIQVSANNQTSGTVQLDVQNTRPGLYTTQPGGGGQAKVVNQVGTLNSRTNPAPKGSVIAAYASGLGLTQPLVGAGQAPPSNPLSVTVQTVTATIAGVPGTVSFAGPAPGITGVYQVNILVSQQVTSGTRELVIAAGGSASQESVFVEIQ